jgi:hypothetical protein
MMNYRKSYENIRREENIKLIISSSAQQFGAKVQLIK